MSKSNKVVWTDEILLFIIKHVKAAPFVWDHSHPQFMLKSRKAKFWSLLAEKVNTYGKFSSATPVTKEALQKKWTNMKTYYLFEDSKSRQIGSDVDNFSTTWKFRSILSFLNSSPGSSSRSQQSSQATPNESKNSTAVAANVSESSLDFSEDDPLATQEYYSPSITIKTEPEAGEESSIEDATKYMENEHVEDPLPPARSRGKGVFLTPKYTHKANFYHYGMTVAQDLDQLDEDYKIDAKLEIMQIIAKYKREQYLNQNDNYK